MECYFISGSPPCWSVMLALAVKGLAYEKRRLDNAKREQKSEAFLAVNPRGTVPVLVSGEVAVRETNAILAYLDALCPEPGLYGESPAELAEIWQIATETGKRLLDPIGDVTRPIFRGRAAEMADTIHEDIAPIHGELRSLEQRLSQSAYLVGERLSAADLVVYPAVMQLQRGATREGAQALGLGVVPLVETYPGIAAWALRIEAIPGYASAYPPHWKA